MVKHKVRGITIDWDHLIPVCSNLPKENDKPSIIARELATQTDRGMAIIGMAYVEEAITDLLQQILRHHDKAFEILLDPSRGALGPFSAKNHLARALNVYGDEMYADLKTLAQIRNKFAHWTVTKGTAEKVSFRTAPVTDLCNNLLLPKRAGFILPDKTTRPPRTNRQRYFVSVISYVGLLMVWTAIAEFNPSIQELWKLPTKRQQKR